MSERKQLTIIIGLLGVSTILFAETRINSNTSYLQLFPSVTKTDSGYITAFVSNHMSGRHCEIYAQRVDDSVTVEWGSDLYVSNHDDEDGHRLTPKIIPGDLDTSIIAWINHQNHKIYAQKISPTGSKRWNSENPKEIGAIAAHTLYEPPQICSDGAGGAYFTWVNRYSVGNNFYDTLRIGRVRSDGTFLTNWPVLAKPYNGAITLPRICSDGSGGAKIAWVQDSTGAEKSGEVSSLVRLQGIDSTGQLAYATPKTVAIAGQFDGYYNRSAHKWTGLCITSSGANTILSMRRRLGTGITRIVDGREKKIGVMLLEELYVSRVNANGNVSTPLEICCYDSGETGQSGRI